MDNPQFNVRSNKHDRTATIVRRVLLVVSELRARSYPNKALLAELTESNERTVQRDIKMLREHFGAPIEFDRDQNGFYLSDRRWRLDDGS